MRFEIGNKRQLIIAILSTTLASIVFSNILVCIFETTFSPPLTFSDIIGTTFISGIASFLAASIIFFHNLRLYQTKIDLQKVNKALLQAQEKLLQQANTDALTGLYNRRRFFQSVEQEISRFERHGHFFSFLLMDIDHFKQVNDTFGHSFGDEVLRDLAKTLKDIAREEDVVARTGGEEFCMLLPETQKNEARHLAERIRVTVEDIPMGTEKSVFITLSIGIAESKQHETLDDLYKRADAALYRAKAGGRNRVESA